MKRIAAGFLLSVLLLLPLFALPAFGAEPVWRVLHDQSNFYRDARLSEVIRTLPRNAEVEILEESHENIVKAVYMGETGYLLKSNLYLTSEAIYDGEKTQKITASNLGESVPVHQFPYRDSPVLKTLRDGETVTVKVGGVVYSEYSEVVSDGVTGFVKNENLTDGLTLNGAIALTVGIVTAVLAVLILVLLGYSKRLKNEKRRRDAKLIEEAREYGEQP